MTARAAAIIACRAIAVFLFAQSLLTLVGMLVFATEGPPGFYIGRMVLVQLAGMGIAAGLWAAGEALGTSMVPAGDAAGPVTTRAGVALGIAVAGLGVYFLASGILDLVSAVITETSGSRSLSGNLFGVPYLEDRSRAIVLALVKGGVGTALAVGARTIGRALLANENGTE